MTIHPSTPMYCANHPNRETNLRCNRCEKPICIECAVLTPTGYRCKECVRGQQKKFDTAQWIDYPLAMLISAALCYLGSLIVSYLSFFTIFVSPIIGVIIAEAVRKAIRGHRSKRLFQFTTAALIVGGLPKIVIILLGFGITGLNSGGNLSLFLPLIWQSIYLFVLVPTFYYRLAGNEI